MNAVNLDAVTTEYRPTCAIDNDLIPIRAGIDLPDLCVALLVEAEAA
ncbi:hypothetical protein HGO38_04595 [Rhizobium sp. CG5]|nr:hypothetical protein [Rhizobium sp. CG5]MCM2472756.1 hypothetical protein [Rhizobium sp. CG5]